ncbi:MAG: hypothetical protein HY059_05010 [Proteobacteria bacterium]|nr:hypothetical protein [Pseudomonadota bacterium]
MNKHPFHKLLVAIGMAAAACPAAAQSHHGPVTPDETNLRRLCRSGGPCEVSSFRTPINEQERRQLIQDIGDLRCKDCSTVEFRVFSDRLAHLGKSLGKTELAVAHVGRMDPRFAKIQPVEEAEETARQMARSERLRRVGPSGRRQVIVTLPNKQPGPDDWVVVTYSDGTFSAPIVRRESGRVTKTCPLFGSCPDSLGPIAIRRGDGR